MSEQTGKTMHDEQDEIEVMAQPINLIQHAPQFHVGQAVRLKAIFGQAPRGRVCKVRCDRYGFPVYSVRLSLPTSCGREVRRGVEEFQLLKAP
jgi:hypothetical protein